MSGWERAFVAVSVLLGAELEAALAALPAEGRAGALELVRGLASPAKAARAEALARALAEVALAVDATRLG